ncbi:hypothetical protein ES332_D08G225600v1 [Gossypium tomentosum]|uniref:C2 domain-containing protein n=1 Tax=Gossypium tomentosum TaxID=34277 RepID=A0A5D2JXC9_GOSTO|nr:hypothetical protein ES332_D08G225600v1 [Gossypium tomentosum]
MEFPCIYTFLGSVFFFLHSLLLSSVSPPNMPQGSLEVFLASAKGLEDTDFLFKMDPYVILTCGTQEQKSSVASGSEPVWNENFIFNVSEGAEELKLKIMDSDIGNDDFVGEAEICLKSVLREGRIPPTAYNIVKNKEFCGEIKVGLTFNPEERSSRDYDDRDEYSRGWKESSHSDRDRTSRRDDSTRGRRHSPERERDYRGRDSDEDRRRGGRRRHSSDED